MKIGARIFKTGVAVGLALYISQLFQLEPIIFAGIAAAVTVQPSLYRSWQNSLQQLQANIVGAIVGILLAISLGTQPYIIALGIVIVISINIQLKFTNSIPLAMVTVLAIMSSPTEQFWEVAGDRFLLIFIGVISSIVINIFAPPRYGKRLNNQLFDIQETIAINLRMLLEVDRESSHMRKELQNLSEKMTELEELFTLHREENRYKQRKLSRRTRKLVVFRSMVHTCRQGIETLSLLEKYHDDLFANEMARTLFDEELEELAFLQEKVFLKFAGKVKPHLASGEEMSHEEPILPVEKALKTFNDNEELLVQLLPAVVKLNAYREQLEELDRTVEHYYQFHQNTTP